MGAIVLCRHGVTHANAAGQFLSRTDVHLSEAGEAQCRSLPSWLAEFEFERCLVSPMRRCLQTRAIVAPNISFETYAALREIDFGTWEGVTLDWLEAHDAEGLAQRRRDPVRFRPPAGESFEDVARRLEPLVETLKSAGSALVIAHRGTLGVLERLLRGLPLESQAVRPFEPAEFRILIV
ncbi:MAG TPA: histidine phosphatase family protein [Candidatus Cybelea sp.]